MACFTTDIALSVLARSLSMCGKLGSMPLIPCVTSLLRIWLARKLVGTVSTTVSPLDTVFCQVPQEENSASEALVESNLCSGVQSASQSRARRSEAVFLSGGSPAGPVGSEFLAAVEG